MAVTGSHILFGRHQHRTRQFTMLAGAVFLTSTVMYLYPGIEALPFVWQLMYVPVMIALFGAMVNAYLNDGLLVSTLITVAVALGLVLALGIRVGLGPLGSALFTREPAVLLFITVILFGIGVGAFVVGAGTRRVVTLIG